MGCVGQGCLAAAILGVIGAVVIGAGCWLFFKAVNRYTADRPADIRIEQPTTDAIQQAETKLKQLQNAVRNQVEKTIEFSAADLNTLIASEPQFAQTRGRVRMDMAANDMILDLSAPLGAAGLPQIRGRWFNGRARFAFKYELGEFLFEAKSLEVGQDRMESGSGRGFMSSFLRGFASSYTKSFNRSFQ
jgi:hypothetical protein